MQTLTLKPVKRNDYQFLYDLLAEREPIANISHKKMPTWEEHVQFNNYKPYKKDYILWVGDERVGRLYISLNDEIGIFILKKYQKYGYGTEILKQIIKNGGRFLANIAPNNKRSQKFFEKLGFKLVQYTYKYEGIHP